MYLADSTAPRC